MATRSPTRSAGFTAGLGDALARAALALARRFAAGATLWCLAPAWPEHARHVAVEFVHPVVMGKRALPAVSVDERRPGRRAAHARRAGDRGRRCAHGRRRGAASRRRPAGPGVGRARRSGSAPAPRPPPASPTTCSGSTAPRRRGRHDGRLVLLYHVLWELTHVCFEHPGLLAARPTTATPTAGASPAPTRAAWRGDVAVDGRRGGVRTARGHRDGRHDPGRRRSPPATCCSCTPAPPSRVVDAATAMAERGTDFLYPFIEARRARRRRRSSPTWPHRRWRRPTASAALRATHAGARTRRRWPPPPTRWRRAFAAGGRLFTFGNGGSSTDAAVARRPVRPPAVGRPRPGALPRRRRGRAHRARQRRRLRPRLLPPADRPRSRAATWPSACRRAATRATCSPRSPRPPRAACSPSAWPATTAARWRDRPTSHHCLVVRADSVHRIQEAQAALGFALWAARADEPGATRRVPEHERHATTARPRCSTASRRSGGGAPRFTDDVVTLAHGAGGKASAALVDAVFLAASRRAAAARATTPPTLRRCRPGERLAFTTDSFVVQPRRFPGGSIGHLAVHGTVNDLAVLGARRSGSRPRS